MGSYRVRLPRPARLVVLVSGAGTLLQALLDAARLPGAPAGVVAVGADRAGIEGLARAERAGVPAVAVPLGEYSNRAAWDAALTKTVVAHQPDLVVSAGFMRILAPSFLAGVGCPVINTHPALLPAFPGVRAVADALGHGVKVTGATVHFADLGVDSGPIIAQEAVAVRAGDTVPELHERIKVVERRVLVDVVAALVEPGATVDGRKVSIP